MGYMGIGMQSWISKMKPKKYFGGRSKPDGGGGENLSGIDMKNYYHYKSNKLERLLQKKYSPNYQKKLRKGVKRRKPKTSDLPFNKYGCCHCNFCLPVILSLQNI